MTPRCATSPEGARSDVAWAWADRRADSESNVDLTIVTYNDGATQKLEAVNGVRQRRVRAVFADLEQHVTLVYSHPHRNSPLHADSSRPVPVMMKVESLDTMTPVLRAWKQLQATLERFLKTADLSALTTPYGKPSVIPKGHSASVA